MLAELMVVIAILGVLVGVTGIAFATRAPVQAADALMARVASARSEAVGSGKPATLQLELSGNVYLVTAFPDGRIVTDAPLQVDRLSGRAEHADR